MYAPQPYTNQSVFKSLLNCTSEISLSRNATGREFQRHGPATEKLLSPRRVRVLTVAHVKTSADRSDRRPMSVKSWQFSTRYCCSWPCNALCTRTANLKSMRCRTGNQCSSRRTGVICSIDREFEFYEFFSFLKFNEFYEFISVEKNWQKYVILQIIDV